MSQQGFPDFARLNQIVGPALVNLSNFPLAAAYTSGVFAVGMYDTLEIWATNLSAATHYRITVIWWDSIAGTGSLGGSSQYHTINGIPVRVTVPVSALFCQIQMEAFSYATSPLVTLRVFPRVGTPPPATGSVEGQLFSSAGQFVAAGGIAIFSASRVASGPAEIFATIDAGKIYAYAHYVLFDGTTRYFASIESGGGVGFQSRSIRMPNCLVQMVVINLAATAQTISGSLTLTS